MQSAKPNAKRHIAPKVESRIANDLLITTRCGAAHNGIDQPLSDSSRSEIRRQSTELCACPRWTDSNRNALKCLTQLIEQHKQRCGERAALLSEYTSDMTHNQKRMATEDMNALANFEIVEVDRHDGDYTIRPGDNFGEEPPAPQAPTILPQFCNKCDRLIPLPTVKEPGACICCNVEDLTITLSNTRVCKACQLKWLLKFNTHQARTNSLIKQIQESGLSELEFRAKFMLETTGTTDPTLIPPGKRNDINSMDQQLKRRLNIKEGQSVTDKATSIGAYWKSNRKKHRSPTVNTSDTDEQLSAIMNRSEPISKRNLTHVLDLIDDLNGQTNLRVAPYELYEWFTEQRPWSEVIKWLAPARKDEWEPARCNLPKIDHPYLIIPTNVKGGWVFLLR